MGDVARSIYDAKGNGEFIDIHALGHQQAIARSAVLLKSGEVPVFEAGMVAGGALAYADANHILAERTVREPEGVKRGLRRSADGSGQVGVDGDDAVAG